MWGGSLNTFRDIYKWVSASALSFFLKKGQKMPLYRVDVRTFGPKSVSLPPELYQDERFGEKPLFWVYISKVCVGKTTLRLLFHVARCGGREYFHPLIRKISVLGGGLSGGGVGGLWVNW